MSTRSKIGVLAVGGLALLAGLALAYRGRSGGPRFATAAIDRGEITDGKSLAALFRALPALGRIIVAR